MSVSSRRVSLCCLQKANGGASPKDFGVTEAVLMTGFGDFLQKSFRLNAENRGVYLVARPCLLEEEEEKPVFVKEEPKPVADGNN